MHNGGIFHIEIESANICFRVSKIKQAAHDSRICDPWLRDYTWDFCTPVVLVQYWTALRLIPATLHGYIKLKMQGSGNFGRWYRRWPYWQHIVSVIVKLSSVFDFYAGPSARGRQLYCRACNFKSVSALLAGKFYTCYVEPNGLSLLMDNGTTRFHLKDLHLVIIQTNSSQRCVPA